MNKINFLLRCTVFVLSLGAFLEATVPLQWTISTQSEFLQGELKGVSVTSDGKLILAPSLEPILDTEEAFIYTAVLDKSGNLYVGTGNNGKIFRVTPGRQGREWARLEEPGVYALAVDSLNRTYVGTAPDGKVYRLNDRGEAEVFLDPDEKYIWALAFDTQNNLFVATGPKGIIYKVNSAGDSSVFYDSKETHIVTLAWDLDGNLLAGTAPGGLLFRISPDGSPFVVYDSSLQEIKAVSVDRYGNIYAAALSRSKALQEKDRPSQAPNVPQESKQQVKTETAPEVTLKISGTEKGGKLEIYKIDKENLVETLYTSNEELAFDLLIRSNGNLLVATGNKGRIISIDPRRFVTLLVQSPEQQVTRLLQGEGKIYATTSNLGRVFQLLSQPSTTGIYESKVFDTKMLSSWGMIRWRVTAPTSAPVKIYTRSGNTESSDQTWNDWTGPYTDWSGSYIKSPAARFLQWKIEFPQAEEAISFTSQRNAVELVTITYIQHNMAPQLTSITVHPPGAAFVRAVAPNPAGGISPGGPDQVHIRSLPRSVRGLARSRGNLPPPRKVYSPGARSISWRAKDPNGDDLVYSIYYRGQDETSWKSLENDLSDTYYTIDGVSFPDGIYFVKVVASDAPSNPVTQALDSEIISKHLVIANSSPSMESRAPQTQGGRVTWQFTVHTRESVVHQVEYSVDAGEWNILFPEDGIADASSEHYSLALEDLKPGEHVITVRLVDSVGNIGTGKASVSIK
ncbi:hypothetical protein MYX84_01915 [Acidobacteria bacterium AH-259-O06]|nr:hypothetical protein [Acidobacteria bacterium AH-259-O06]